MKFEAITAKRPFAVYFIVVFFAALCALAVGGYHADYLIAPGWSAIARPIGWLASVGSIIWGYAVVSKKGNGYLGVAFPSWGYVLPFLAITSFITFTAVVGFLPLACALIFRQDVQIVYTVAEVQNNASYARKRLLRRRCYSTISLEALPVLQNYICFAPDHVHAQAKPGDKLMLMGWGSRLGVFYNRVERIK